ncbi:MAG TPA: FecR domain-containing protein [Caulobacteraceae bacterium]
MDQDDRLSSRAEDRLRREAAAWFARLRGPGAERHRAAFDIWRTADPERQAVYDRLQQRWDDAGVLTRSQLLGPDIGLGHSTARRARPWALGWSLAGLAAGCALFGLVLVPTRPAWLDQWPLPSIGTPQLESKIGEIRTVRLADGSSVTLDTDTALTLRFSTSMRRISLLRGRARFDVAHDPARPFIVAAGGGAVAARGTLFDVSLSPDRQVSVTLLRGAVEIDPAPGAPGAGMPHPPPLRLAPGQQFAFGHAIATPQIQPASPSASLWPSGLLTFDDTPLSEALAEANRYSHNRIVLADPSLAALQVSGVFRATAPHELAASLAGTFDLHVETAPNGDVLLTRPSQAAPAQPAT